MGHRGHEIAEGLPGAGAGLDEKVRAVVDSLGDGFGHGNLTRPFHAADSGDGGMEEFGEGWLRHRRTTLRLSSDITIRSRQNAVGP
ncbi:hypothetical protein GCM10010232_54780 [Streptomyces amakusaensis]